MLVLLGLLAIAESRQSVINIPLNDVSNKVQNSPITFTPAKLKTEPFENNFKDNIELKKAIDATYDCDNAVKCNVDVPFENIPLNPINEGQLSDTPDNVIVRNDVKNLRLRPAKYFIDRNIYEAFDIQDELEDILRGKDLTRYNLNRIVLGENCKEPSEGNELFKHIDRSRFVDRTLNDMLRKAELAENMDLGKYTNKDVIKYIFGDKNLDDDSNSKDVYMLKDKNQAKHINKDTFQDPVVVLNLGKYISYEREPVILNMLRSLGYDDNLINNKESDPDILLRKKHRADKHWKHPYRHQPRPQKHRPPKPPKPPKPPRDLYPDIPDLPDIIDERETLNHREDDMTNLQNLLMLGQKFIF